MSGLSSTSTAGPSRGMPILSGPPPITESSACRQCAKQFNPLWRRSHACGHCGYEYCSSCISDGQALMPRRPGQATSSNPFSAIKDELGIGKQNVGSGYEVERVCLHCLSMLQVTAAPMQILRSLPLKRLKEYIGAYDIPCVGPKEKEDFVQAVMRARNPATGCLSPEAESYYRRKSVPKNLSAEINGDTSSTSRPSPAPAVARPPPNSSPRPPPPNNYRPPPPSNYRPPPSQSQNYYRPPPPPPQNQYRSPPNHNHRPTPPQPVPARPTPRPAQPAPPKAAPTPPPPVPTILSLVSLPKSYLSSLSIGTLKAVLYENHVRVDFKQVLEKQELINRVDELIRDERKRLERQRIEEEREAAAANGYEANKPPTPPIDGEEGSAGRSEEKKVPTGPMPEIERGLCVVCQDEEATLAVVDCGHLAMCAHCSDLIMATSQECPLCRTRIVTPQRLIRIYRV